MRSHSGHTSCATNLRRVSQSSQSSSATKAFAASSLPQGAERGAERDPHPRAKLGSPVELYPFDPG